MTSLARPDNPHCPGALEYQTRHSMKVVDIFTQPRSSTMLLQYLRAGIRNLIRGRFFTSTNTKFIEIHTHIVHRDLWSQVLNIAEMRSMC